MKGNPIDPRIPSSTPSNARASANWLRTLVSFGAKSTIGMAQRSGANATWLRTVAPFGAQVGTSGTAFKIERMRVPDRGYSEGIFWS